MDKASRKRLVLIDGHAIIHRAYHALPPLTSPGGRQTNAVYGFISMLFRVITELKPAYLAVAFDLPIPTFRHEAYIAYQAHRPHMEQEMKDQIELVHEVVKAAGIPIYTAPGFEADDVIGTLAKQAGSLQSTVYSQKEKKKKAVVGSRLTVDEVIIVTGDRDMLQLVTDKVEIYVPIKGLSEAKLFDKKAVKEYIGLEPKQIVDYKALIGDQSDNYPGVRGIGPRTAVDLLRRFGSLENIYKETKKQKNRKTIPVSVPEKLEKGYEAALLSQRLARISTDVPIELDLERAKFEALEKNERFILKLQEFGFKSLVHRLTGKTENSKAKIAKEEENPPLGGNGQIELL